MKGRGYWSGSSRRFSAIDFGGYVPWELESKALLLANPLALSAVCLTYPFPCYISLSIAWKPSCTFVLRVTETARKEFAISALLWTMQQPQSS